ncbi:hypothetical protein CYMTET_6567 [Cymbomonas tetramitiformis]|uniref:Uncharacterized protein n=1 Tax=Cymbomonas tetramitiformis TaxID=36881 RepID=A0AAE0GWY5_9CHLO|nr:hypothetical protein CYMTET_6567 [Cymbomonas tetramitiformis]|eukprot:gene2131-2829_t
MESCFPGHKRCNEKVELKAENYQKCFDTLKNEAKLNGLRFPILVHGPKAEEYTDLYKEMYSYARDSLGMHIYAVGLTVGHDMGDDWKTTEEGKWSEDPEQYTTWMADYVNYFKPDFVSPCKESGWDWDKMEAVVTLLRSKIEEGCPTKILGPDTQHVKYCLNMVKKKKYPLEDLFDVISTHSADNDFTADEEAHRELVDHFAEKGKPVWNSENPSYWKRGKEPSVVKDSDHPDGLPGVEDALKVSPRYLYWKMSVPSPQICSLN